MIHKNVKTRQDTLNISIKNNEVFCGCGRKMNLLKNQGYFAGKTPYKCPFHHVKYSYYYGPCAWVNIEELKKEQEKGQLLLF